MPVYFLVGVLVDHLEHRKVRAATQAGELLQCVLRLSGHTVHLAAYQVPNIIRVILRPNSAQIPGPLSFAMIESEQSFVGKLGNELDCEKRIPCRLFMDQFCEGTTLVRFTMKGI